MSLRRAKIRCWRQQGLAVAGFCVVCSLVSGAEVAAEQWQTVASTSTSVLVEEDTRIKNLDPVLQQLFLPDANMDVKVTAAVQLFPLHPRELGINKVKGKGRARFGCQSPRGQRNLGTKTGRFDSDGNVAFSRQVPQSFGCDSFFVEWEFLKNLRVPEGNSIEFHLAAELVEEDASDDCFDKTVLCLNGDRFEVEMNSRDLVGGSGSATALPRTDDSGLFFFFDPDNWEMLVKVLDGCDFNQHYWIFAAASTDVEYTLSVTDTQTDQTRTYRNELGRPAQAITDTSAFATCP